MIIEGVGNGHDTPPLAILHCFRRARYTYRLFMEVSPVTGHLVGVYLDYCDPGSWREVRPDGTRVPIQIPEDI